MPQEIEVWYLIPSLRKELAKILISDFGMTQKKVSKILGITESAVSQYLKLKRGNELNFSGNDIEKIRETACNIVEKGNANEELYKLSVKFRGSNIMCDFHKKSDGSIPKDCDLCVT